DLPPHPGNVVGIIGDLGVGNQERAVVLPLQLHPVLERTRVVAEMKRSGGTDSGQDALERLTHRLCLRAPWASGAGARRVERWASASGGVPGGRQSPIEIIGGADERQMRE